MYGLSQPWPLASTKPSSFWSVAVPPGGGAFTRASSLGAGGAPRGGGASAGGVVELRVRKFFSQHPAPGPAGVLFPPLVVRSVPESGLIEIGLANWWPELNVANDWVPAVL